MQSRTVKLILFKRVHSDPQVKSERTVDAEEMQRLRKENERLRQEIQRIKEEENATQEAREIYRSKLERALEDELLACRKQLEQKHRDCQAEVEASARMSKEHAEQLRHLQNKLKDAHRAIEAMRTDRDNLKYGPIQSAIFVYFSVHDL